MEALLVYYLSSALHCHMPSPELISMVIPPIGWSHRLADHTVNSITTSQWLVFPQPSRAIPEPMKARFMVGPMWVVTIGQSRVYGNKWTSLNVGLIDMKRQKPKIRYALVLFCFFLIIFFLPWPPFLISENNWASAESSRSLMDRRSSRLLRVHEPELRNEELNIEPWQPMVSYSYAYKFSKSLCSRTRVSTYAMQHEELESAGIQSIVKYRFLSDCRFHLWLAFYRSMKSIRGRGRGRGWGWCILHAYKCNN